MVSLFRGRCFLYTFLIIYHVALFLSFSLVTQHSAVTDVPFVKLPPGGNDSPPKEENHKDTAKLQAQEIDSLVHRSTQLLAENKWEESLQLLDDGLSKFPYSDKLHSYKGSWYYYKANYTEALKLFKRAGELNTNETMYLFNAALCLVNLAQVKEANEFYKKAYAISPNTGTLVTVWDNQCKLNDWEDYEAHESQLVYDIRNELKTNRTISVQLYWALHLPFTLKEFQDIGASFSKQTKENALKQTRKEFVFDNRDEYRKIKVGYVSYDFCNHAVGIQVQNMFEFHNRSRFEIYAYNVNDGAIYPYDDHVYKKIKGSVDHMVDFTTNLESIATRIYEDEIDVLVDLGLLTPNSRMDVFSLRPAPIQVAYLGLAATTGADYYDYMVADRYVIPPENEEFYSEKLVFMPHSYHVLNHKQMYSTQKAAPRKDHKLPEEKFLYCNHANNMRLDPQIFDYWSEIVKRVNNSALVLRYFNEDAASNLRKEAEKRGLKVSQNHEISDLLFLPRAEIGEHIQIKAMCDLYLDVHKYNGHSTSADMLWAGVPMVTYPGQSMASRAAASFAISVGLPEMITKSWEEYIERAIELGTDREQYKALRETLENTRVESPLFDTRRWVKNWETALITMVSNYDQGKQIQNIEVKE